jgi:uncharacterized protein YcbK (DUF882 family)
MKDYFPESDFAKCNPPCKKSDMNPESLRKLNATRHEAQIPFVLTSAYRTVEHDKSKGRSGNSAHTRGYAFDVSAVTSQQKLAIVKAALNNGFTRIGVHKSFIHLDDDKTLAQNVLWLY